ncbi:hypothetical protein [Streptomyces sp. VRA16 Mangrove soil]|uniref:hypothetical protein n=1 Tax=Streptomyces sp. VRA16 Mangrove soil TaxID=2817434 RepID=UPI001A9FD3AC|nr:hypothetical protein [Streptomyces sp. VRA16 Mangrove soil]MBO1336898.1 hypothetical protein [Streptomyces sp. VRA16 Mangrove soil]
MEDEVLDRHWAHEVRAALLCSGLTLGLATAIDAEHETLSPARAALWTGLSLLLYGVLHPPRVSAGPGRLVVRGLWRRRHVCTDLLVSVRRTEGVAPRLELRDTLGSRVACDPAVLLANPVLWHQVETGARRALARGLMTSGEDVVRVLAARLDGDLARPLFEAAGLSARGARV